MRTAAVRVCKARQDGETPYMLRRLMMLSAALIFARWRAVPTQVKPSTAQILTVAAQLLCNAVPLPALESMPAESSIRSFRSFP